MVSIDIELLIYIGIRMLCALNLMEMAEGAQTYIGV